MALYLVILGFILGHVNGQLPKRSYPHGIFEGIPISTFTQSVESGGWGFRRCWEEPYATRHPGRVGDVIEFNPTCPTDYDEKPYWLMFGGCRSGPDRYCTGIIYNGAVTTYDILDLETEGDTPVEDQRGVWWYHRELYSFGYSGTSTIQLNSCDINCRDLNEECAREKLCWHLSNVGGWRVGNITGLNGSPDWNKMIFYKPVEGLLTGVHRRFLAQMDYTECFFNSYRRGTTINDIFSGGEGRCPSIISPDEKWDIVIGAIDETDSASYLAHGAMVSSQVLYEMTRGNRVNEYDGGLHFYHRDGRVFGYTSLCDSPDCVDLSDGCDSVTGIGERLCWFVDGSTPGYRAGDNLDLGAPGESPPWRRFVAVRPAMDPTQSPVPAPIPSPTVSPSVSPTTQSPTLSPTCDQRCTARFCQLDGSAGCSASVVNRDDILVNPIGCRDRGCGDVRCNRCGNQRDCVRNCKAWLVDKGLDSCWYYRRTWCANQCKLVSASFKCWHDCRGSYQCPPRV